ncbi:aspartate aminotransferase [alpha proteobacterium U9-1i]|nr:aspartate aminotransferase [alpha proteobacterium U9-1i]
MLTNLTTRPPDPLLKIIAMFREDPRADKIDLGVGVYKDTSGATPLMRAVKVAEQTLLNTQTTKTYVGQQGDADFLNLFGELAFGAIAPDLVSIQTVGGTGALRLGFDLLKASGAKRVLVPTPTWPNHPAIIRASGLEQIDVEFFNVADQKIDLDALLAAFKKLEPGDAVLLQGCCHNPLGADFDMPQWRALTEAIVVHKLIAYIDVAYIGFGDGIDEDVAGVRHVLAHAPEVIVATSCAKSFGIYRERVGGLYVKAAAEARAAVRSNLFGIARANYSMPPDHGAATVREVLKDATLRQAWRDELDENRAHIKGTRAALAASRVNAIPMHLIAAQKGMFTTLPLNQAQIDTLRTAHGIYMTDAARINVAGLRRADIPRFLEALGSVTG